jgi:EAL and modified HD-GYP domain-containing signal transduction protein
VNLPDVASMLQMDAENSADVVQTADVRIGRQGIYDISRRLVAHELLFRGVSATSAALPAPRKRRASEGSGLRFPDDQDRATSQVIAATFGDFGVQMLGGGKPLFINLTRPFLVGDYPLPFGPGGVVLEVLEHVVVDDQLLMGLRDLRARGFLLAADDFVGEPERWSLLPYVDFVKVDVLALEMPLDELVSAVLAINPTITLLAERIEDPADLVQFDAAGFTMFQGFAFARPAVLKTTRMSPSQVVCARLLRALADPESTVHDLEQIVAADPGLSLRVLRTANSSASGSVRKISSLHQAVVLLGPVVLSAWVILTLMGELGAGRRDDLVLVLTRAVACEELARQVGQDPSAAYTAGLLSGIASVLGSNPEEVAAGAGLDESLARAIADGSGPVGVFVGAVECHERDDVVGLASTGVSPFEVSRAYLFGLSAALSTVEDVLGPET